MRSTTTERRNDRGAGLGAVGLGLLGALSLTSCPKQQIWPEPATTAPVSPPIARLSAATRRGPVSVTAGKFDVDAAAGAGNDGAAKSEATELQRPIDNDAAAGAGNDGAAKSEATELQRPIDNDAAAGVGNDGTEGERAVATRSVASEGERETQWEPSWLISIGRETWVYERPRYDSVRLGYLRFGSKVQRDARPAGTSSCAGGWYAPQGGFAQRERAKKSTKVEDIFGGMGGGGLSDFFEKIFGSVKNTINPQAQQQKANPNQNPNAKVNQEIGVEVEISLEDAFKGCQKAIKNGADKIEINLHKGIEDGKILKVPAKNSKASDILVTVKVAKNERFERRGDDLHADFPVDVYTAVLGGQIEFSTLSGKVKITIPAESQADNMLKLRGQGMPKYGVQNERGDLYLKIKITIPKSLTAKEKQLFAELKKIREK